LRAGNRRSLVERFEQAPLGSTADRIVDVKTPTLILWGGRDRLASPKNAERFRQDIAGSQVVMFDDLGHVPHEEDPVRTVAAAKKFLGLD
jgi:pimeloyl-ACP methyl ester carboxylesterase